MMEGESTNMQNLNFYRYPLAIDKRIVYISFLSLHALRSLLPLGEGPSERSETRDEAISICHLSLSPSESCDARKIRFAVWTNGK